MEPLVLRCDSLAPALAELQSAGLALVAICPADGPVVAVLASSSGRPVHLIQDNAHDWKQCLDICTGGDPPMPPLINAKYSIKRAPTVEERGVGRAGMCYNDLIEDRLNGRVVGSLISVPDGGLLNDYVHHHRIRFQLIYCRRGWVRVLYENNGEPFVMEPGDCVLQPPHIRHRVLEASKGMEVVEIASPSVHATFTDREMVLPNGVVDTEKVYGQGQKFVRHEAKKAEYKPSRFNGWMERDTEIGAATSGNFWVRALKPSQTDPADLSHSGELLFWFILSGSVELTKEDDGSKDVLNVDDSVCVPSGMKVVARSREQETEILEVHFPHPA